MMRITILITAFLIKRFPTRPLFLLSVGIFSGGILLAALAQTFAVLLVGRLIQAAAGGIITSLRTVAGSLGAAVFTSIMMVAAQNETVAGQVFGVNVAFAVMCALAAVLFGIAVVKIK